MNEVYSSPNGEHTFTFINEGEIRFGPSYNAIVLNGIRIANRLFGSAHEWSANSRYLALQEWLTTNYQRGLCTALSIVNTERKQIARVSQTNDGFITPLYFENNRIIFQKGCITKGLLSEFEITLSDITQWQDL